MDKWLVPVAIAAAVVTYSHIVDRLEGLENGKKTNENWKGWKKWRFWDKKKKGGKGGTSKLYKEIQKEYRSGKGILGRKVDRREYKTGDLLRAAKLRAENPDLLAKGRIWKLANDIDKATQYVKDAKKKNASVPTAPAPETPAPTPAPAPETPAPAPAPVPPPIATDFDVLKMQRELSSGGKVTGSGRACTTNSDCQFVGKTAACDRELGKCLFYECPENSSWTGASCTPSSESAPAAEVEVPPEILQASSLSCPANFVAVGNKCRPFDFVNLLPNNQCPPSDVGRYVYNASKKVCKLQLFG